MHMLDSFAPISHRESQLCDLHHGLTVFPAKPEPMEVSVSETIDHDICSWARLAI